MPEITLKLGDTVVQSYVFDKEVFNIGRSRDNDIVIETLSVSRNHARIRAEGDRFVLIDLQSANGTYVNGTKINKAEILGGDQITVSKHQLSFTVNDDLIGQNAVDDMMTADRTVLVDTAPVGVLVVTQGKQKNQEFVVDRYETMIGRSEECQVQLHDWFVARRHAKIRREKDGFTIVDLKSVGGVQLNGMTVKDSSPLHEGDEIKIGPVRLEFMIQKETGPQPTGRMPIELPLNSMDNAQLPAPMDEEPSAAGRGVESADDEPVEPTPIEEEIEQELEPMFASSNGDDDSPPPLGLEDENEAVDQAEDMQDPEYEESQDAEEEPEESASSSLSSEALVAEEALNEAEDHAREESVEEAPEQVWQEDEESEMDENALARGDESDEDGEVVAAELEDSSEDALSNEAERVDSAIPAGVSGNGAVSEDAQSASPEIAIWERALENPSPVIRREAARQLRKLTGKDYDV